MIRDADEELTTTICFHLQQHVEKSIKACLMDLHIQYGKTHDLIQLVELLPYGDEIEDEYFEELISLSSYATTSKYSVHAPSISEMENAFETAPIIVSLLRNCDPRFDTYES